MANRPSIFLLQFVPTLDGIKGMPKLNNEPVFRGVRQVEFKIVVFEYTVAGGTPEMFTFPNQSLVWTFNFISIVTSAVVKLAIMFRKIRNTT